MSTTEQPRTVIALAKDALHNAERSSDTLLKQDASRLAEIVIWYENTLMGLEDMLGLKFVMDNAMLARDAANRVKGARIVAETIASGAKR